MSAPRKPAAFQPRSVQVAEHIKELLRSGRWQDGLPSERFLAAEVGVSRDTIRAALALLSKEGAILERRRSGTRVKRLSRPLSPGGIRVGFLLLMKIEVASHRTLAWVDAMSRLFYRNGIEVEVYDGYGRKKGFFERISRISNCQFWVLIYPNHRALRWCAESKARVVVAGTVPEETGIPSVDIHYRAVCRHGVGQMARYGHRDVVLILHRREWGADAESVAGFQEGAARYGKMVASVEYHNGTREGLCALADRLLAREPRPTAWMIVVPMFFLTIMMHLQRRGIRIPEEISLISQDAEPWLNSGMPEPTRYQAKPQDLAKNAVRLILAGVTGKSLAAKAYRIFPEFLEGGTLGPAPRSIVPPSAPTASPDDKVPPRCEGPASV